MSSLPPLILPRSLSQLAPSSREAKAAKTASDFEAQFLKSMLEQVYAGLKGEGPLGDAGPGGEAWRSLLIEQQAKAMAARGGIGLAPHIYREALKPGQGALNVSA